MACAVPLGDLGFFVLEYRYSDLSFRCLCFCFCPGDVGYDSSASAASRFNLLGTLPLCIIGLLTASVFLLCEEALTVVKYCHCCPYKLKEHEEWCFITAFQCMTVIW